MTTDQPVETITAPVDVWFNPVVTATVENGQVVRVEIEWSDSLSGGTYVNEAGELVELDGYDEPCRRAAEALDGMIVAGLMSKVLYRREGAPVAAGSNA